jgi:pimeloyl-ACP methyl ester carboxylesterase
MIVILHGWSDSSASMRRLSAAIAALALPGGVRAIRLADYVSMDDDVDFEDLARAMDRAWRDAGLPLRPRSVDLVVHSTGALVARRWLTSRYTPATNPVRRLLMLAPANFGSPLAHKGRSFLGRVVKGFGSRRRFHTGARLLEGLELASPLTWDLAVLDRFGAGDPWYGPGRMLATVLVGTAGYTGIAAAANQPGSDGTVLVAGANLQPAYIDLDFASEPQAPRIASLGANGRVAFRRVSGDNHNTIAWKDRGPANAALIDLVRAALTVTDAGFDAHLADMATGNAAERQREAGSVPRQGYQNTVVRVTDDYGHGVRDYFIEAFVKRPAGGRPDNAMTRRIQEEVLVHAHSHSGNPAFRALRFNCDALQTMLIDRLTPLHLRISAQPDIRDTGSVGYRTLEYRDIGSIRIDPADLGRLFKPDRTALINLRIRREHAPTLVRFSAA